MFHHRFQAGKYSLVRCWMKGSFQIWSSKEQHRCKPVVQHSAHARNWEDNTRAAGVTSDRVGLCCLTGIRFGASYLTLPNLNFFHCKIYICSHFNDSEVRICFKIDGSINKVVFFSLSKICFLTNCTFYNWQHLGNKIINLYSVTESDTLWHLILNSGVSPCSQIPLLRENWGSWR